MAITLRLLTMADVEDLHPRLRVEDKEETVCLGSNPRQALLMGAFDNVFLSSRGRAYALVNPEGTVIGAIGFTSSGALWALSAKFTPSERRELFSRTDEIVERLLKEASEKRAFFSPDAPFLHNLIHARNKPAIKWLKWSELFRVEDGTPLEINGETFYYFRTLQPWELTLNAMPPEALTQHV